METEKRKKKKGFLETMWESMTKTGGCCGGGQSCCGPSNEAGNKTTEKEPIKNRTTEKKNQ
jgi:hypothetical protein